MAFPGNFEAELLLSLHKAVVDKYGWTEFLARLAGTTNARFAAMIVRTAGSAGAVHMVNATPNGSPASISSDSVGAILSDRLRPERIYSASELSDISSAAEVDTALRKLDATALRAMRVVVSKTLSVTIGIFGPVEFDAADGAILRRLFPYLKSSTSAAATVARERFRASLSASLARKTSKGWFLLDRDGVIVETAHDSPDRMPGLQILAGPQDERMALTDRTAQSALADILDRCATEIGEGAAAVRISDSPLLYLRVSPFPQADFPWPGKPVAWAVLHGEAQMTPDSAGLLADLFGLLPSEARLARALASGKSLAEAGEQMGLTIETVRNYSKKIFAKTGTRGQTDLVRSILASGLAELPDSLLGSQLSGRDESIGPSVI